MSTDLMLLPGHLTRWSDTTDRFPPRHIKTEKNIFSDFLGGPSCNGSYWQLRKDHWQRHPVSLA